MPPPYAFNHPVLLAVIRTVDAVLGLFARRARSRPPEAPKRILVCNQAHLGDAVLSTAVLPVLRAQHPQAEIGMLVHPDGARVTQDHPEVLHVHVVEHWHLNRRDRWLPMRLLRHLRSSWQARRAIRAIGYDLAIDLYSYFPNSIPLLSRCRIPHLAGWDSGGFGPLLDTRVSNPAEPLPMLERHARLLQRLGYELDEPLNPYLPLAESVICRWQDRASREGLPLDSIVLHLGAYASLRRWPIAHWIELTRGLLERGWPVMLLGHSREEVDLCGQIHRACPDSIDLGGRLGWSEMLAAVSTCALMVGHDSAPIHVARAYRRPRVCLAAGINDLKVWLHASASSAVLMNPVPCAPCGRSKGCASMACIRSLPVGVVLEAIDRMLPARLRNAQSTGRAAPR